MIECTFNTYAQVFRRTKTGTDRNNNPVYSESSNGIYSCRIRANTEKELTPEKSIVVSSHVGYFSYNADIIESDYLLIENKRYEVISVKPIMNMSNINHLVISLIEIK